MSQRNRLTLTVDIEDDDVITNISGELEEGSTIAAPFFTALAIILEKTVDDLANDATSHPYFDYYKEKLVELTDRASSGTEHGADSSQEDSP